MKLSYLIADVVMDFQTILDHENVSFSDPNLDHGAGFKILYQLLTKVSQDRAYDDSHPFYQNNTWVRILPFDGRDYCFFYNNEQDEKVYNDTHVKTLLKAVKLQLK